MSNFSAVNPAFVEWFQTVSGINFVDRKVNEDGWVLVKPKPDLSHEEREGFKVLQISGSREVALGNPDAGLWIKPWPALSPRTFVALTLTEYGVNSSRLFADVKVGGRCVFYIARVEKGTRSFSTIVHGNFLLDFEAEPSKALMLLSGEMQQIFHPRDLRIADWSVLTPAEIADTKKRLTALSNVYPNIVESLMMSLYS